MLASPDTAALVIENAVVSYGRVPVLEGVAGRVEPGESVALIGPNGAGKTTLIRAVLGLVPLVSGSITVFGGAPREMRGRIAYVPQADTLDADFPVSAIDVVLMGRYRKIGWLRRPSRADRDLAKDALATVGLAHKARERFGALSGGQRQRVLLARAIAQQADLLLLDEPFNGIDASTQELLLETLEGLRSAGAAVVISTHDLSVAHLACDEACLLNRHQFGFGPVAETLTPDMLRAAYGGHARDLGGDHPIVAHP